MKQSLNVKETLEMMKFVSQQIISQQDSLNEMDRRIGDGDHGTSMARGFEAVYEKLCDEELPTDLASLFLSIGNVLLSAVGGSAGVIFGTFFRSGSKAFIDQENLDSEKYSEFLNLAMNAVMKRGGAKPGDKTMLDALYPAVIITQELTNAPVDELFNSLMIASAEGAEKTKKMEAAFGRAKTFGTDAIGYPDPGAITTSLMFKYMHDYIVTSNS